MTTNDRNLPDWVDFHDLCTVPHDWVNAELRLEDPEAPLKGKVCLSCGFILGTVKMLNGTALLGLIESFQHISIETQKQREVTKLVEFEMTAFFDEWVAANGKLLTESLSDVAKVEQLHQVLFHLVNQANFAASKMVERISQEVEAKTESTPSQSRC